MTVSVIISTWNRSAVAEKAVRSALDQTFPPMEVLVCDDGSTDDTEQMVRSINDNRVIWLPGERAGRPAVPRNRGIRKSRGEWIAFLDDDDEWLPQKLAAQLELTERLNCRASCTSALRTFCSEVPTGYSLGWSGECLTFLDLLQGNRIICSSAMIHRSVLNKVVGFPEAVRFKAIEDYAFWLRVAAITNFAFVNEPLVTYMDSPQTSIRTVCKDAWLQKRRVMANFLAWGCRKKISGNYLLFGFRSYCNALLIQAKNQLTNVKTRFLGCC